MIESKKRNFNIQTENITDIKFRNFNSLTENMKKSNSSFLDFANNIPPNFLKLIDLNEINEYSEFFTTYNDIINQIESLINDLNKSNFESIFLCLIEIKKAINKIISNQIILKRNKSANLGLLFDIEDDKNKINQNLKQTFNQKYTSLNDDEKEGDKLKRINSTYINDSSSELKIKNNKIKKLKKKYSNLEEKIKIEEFKYLFCIGEQQKKIRELEKELNKKDVDHLTPEELKKYRCFPNYRQYDILGRYTSKNRTSISYYKKKCKDYFFEKYNNLNTSENIKENDKEINKIKENNDPIKNTKKIIEYGEKVFYNKEKEGNKLLNKGRKYFLSHPKLKYLKTGLNMKSWKTNELLNSMPKQFMSNKLSYNTRKNKLTVFPSSVNQIIVNLEKLRIHNNLTYIESEYT